IVRNIEKRGPARELDSIDRDRAGSRSRAQASLEVTRDIPCAEAQGSGLHRPRRKPPQIDAYIHELVGYKIHGHELRLQGCIRELGRDLELKIWAISESLEKEVPSHDVDPGDRHAGVVLGLDHPRVARGVQ